MEKINLGCGTDIKEGFLNVDYQKNKGVDKIINLDKTPYPFKSSSFTKIFMQDIFEHLKEPVNVLEEIYRISKKDAIIKIRVPHFSSGNSWGDITHQRTFSSTAFDNFLVNKNTSSLETKRNIKFRIVKKKLLFPKPYRFLGFNQIFSLIPIFYERILYGLFPCGNIYFELEVIKD